MEDNMEGEKKIFIATHKKFTAPKNNIYIPIHVGAYNKPDLGFLKDSSGDNISEKNPYFCELTGVYWIWKNCQADVVGLVHYRRYFYNSFFKNINNIMTSYDIEKILEKKDIIVSKPVYILFSSVRNKYEKLHLKEDLDKCEKIIIDKFPEYKETFDKVMKRHFLYPYNMIITKKEIFDEYGKWMFDILFELEKQIDVKKRDTYNARVFGFLSERLLNVWIEKNKQYKIAKKHVFNTEENIHLQRLNYIWRKLLIFK